MVVANTPQLSRWTAIHLLFYFTMLFVKLQQNKNLISVYHRYAIKNTEIADYLVFEDNILRQGFNGKIIELNW